MIQLTFNFDAILIELLLLCGASFFFIFGKILSQKRYPFWISLGLILFSLGLSLYLPFGSFSDSVSLDFFSAPFKFILLIGALFIVLLLGELCEENFWEKISPELFGFLLFSLLGLLVLISSQDFITFYLSLEVMGFPLYFLIATNVKNYKFSLEASIKYFLLGSLSSLFVLIGIGIVFYHAGSFYFHEVFSHLFSTGAFTGASSGLYVFSLGLVFIFTGLSIKIALPPFHMWSPDTYEGAPLPVTAFMASLVKGATILALVKLLVYFYPYYSFKVKELLILTGLLGIFLGNVMAIKQENIVRMLAYSSIAHAGYAVLGLILKSYLGGVLTGFYVAVYLLTSIGAFGLLLKFKRNTELLKISKLSYLSKGHSFLKFLFIIFMFSLAGIPPTAGFSAKFLIFLSLVHQGYVWVALLALLFSVIGAYPYLRVLKNLYMKNGEGEGRDLGESISLEKSSWKFWIPVIATSFFIILLGVYPQLLFTFLYKSLFFYISSLNSGF